MFWGDFLFGFLEGENADAGADGKDIVGVEVVLESILLLRKMSSHDRGFMVLRVFYFGTGREDCGNWKLEIGTKE